MQTKLMDNDERERLFAEFHDRYWRLVLHVLRKSAPELDEDLLQVGRMALWEAICTYDPSRNMKFSSWLWRVVRLRAYEWRAAAGYAVSVPYHVVSSGKVPEIRFTSIHEFEAEREEWMPAPEELVHEECGYAEIERSIDRSILISYLKQYLTERQWTCVAYYFGILGGECLTMHNIAELLGVCKQAVHYSIRGAMEKLRKQSDLADMLM